MKKLAIIFLISILSAGSLFSQSEMDAFRFSHIEPGGTARFTAMGGAFTALGGDFGSFSTNPAGIGIFRRSEFSITPTLGYNLVNSTYYGTTEEDMKYDFNLNNVGVVFSFPIGSQTDEGGWRYFNIGFGMNRHNNFNSRWIAEGFNPESSLMTDFLQQATAEGIDNLDKFSTGLAYDTWLLGEENGEFFVDMPDGRVLQRQETSTSGSIREMVLTAGANFDNRIYLGASVGFPSVRYEEETQYRETDPEGQSEVFNSLTYTNRLTTRGSGYNFKFGAIVWLTEMIRVGGAIHTPTFYDLDDSYRASMRSDLNLDYTSNFAESPRGRFNYDINTPLRAMGGLGLVFGNMGLVSLDYEYADYTKMRLRSSDYMFSDENRSIRENFTQQHIVRVGGELRLEPLILRAGYGFYSNPYEESVNDRQQSVISAGIGIRDANYSLDFSYSIARFDEDFFLYNPDLVQAVEKQYSISAFRLTMGWRF